MRMHVIIWLCDLWEWQILRFCGAPVRLQWQKSGCRAAGIIWVPEALAVWDVRAHQGNRACLHFADSPPTPPPPALPAQPQAPNGFPKPEKRVQLPQQPAAGPRSIAEWEAHRICPSVQGGGRQARDHGPNHQPRPRLDPAQRCTSGSVPTRALVANAIACAQREQEQRDSLSQTLRAVRSEHQQASTIIERLQQRNEDLQRQLSLAQSSERSAKSSLRSAESSARSLREEMLRLKTTVQQVRTSCANDVRKRDVQIQRLKSHLTAQQRGNRTGLVGASITITPGSTGSGPTSMGKSEDMPNVEDAECSLKQETTEFLTQLSQGLSDENDNLIGLVRSTLATLRELQGMPELGHSESDPEEGHENTEDSDAHMMHALPTSYEALATDMDHVLDNLRSLLTNPNFVSITEVETREEEIIKLREGWEKMEARWRDVVTMMQGWRQRMMDSGDTITLDELKMGLGPGEMLAPVAEEDEEEEFDSEVDMEDEDMDDIEEEPELPSPEKPVPHERKTDLFDIKLEPTPHHALRESDGNTRSPRKVIFAPSSRSTPSHNVSTDENASEVDLIKSDSRRSSRPSSRPTSRPASTNKPPPSATRNEPQPVSEKQGRPTIRESGIPRSVRFLIPSSITRRQSYSDTTLDRQNEPNTPNTPKYVFTHNEIYID